MIDLQTQKFLLGLLSAPFQRQLSNIGPVLWLTPLFPVDYTRSIAKARRRHASISRHSSGNGRPGSADGGKGNRRKDTRGRLGHDEPLESVGRVNLQKRIVRWTREATPRLIHKVVAVLLRNATPVYTFRRAPMGEDSGAVPPRGAGVNTSATWSPDKIGSRTPPHPNVIRSAIRTLSGPRFLRIAIRGAVLMSPLRFHFL